METELRLAVPAAALVPLRARLLALPGAERIALRATYFDSPARELAAQGWGLRLRLEGAQWVQTLKGPLALDGISRPEFNVPRDGPVLALEAFPAELQPLLAPLAGQLQPQFETAIERLQVLQQGLLWALDEGELRAGSTQRAAVAELELELVDASLAQLLAQARELVQQDGLLLEPRSKAARGGALARGLAVPPTDFDRQRSLDALDLLS